MIKIDKPRQAPSIFRSNKVRRARNKIRNIINNRNFPSKTDFPPHWGDKRVREKLWKMQHEKCCYCERKRDMARESDIEHFRPKTEIQGQPKPGYWWLAYHWSNLFFSCRKCNQDYKKTQFPIKTTGIRATLPSHNLNLEEAILIDPSKEDPEDFIAYDWWTADGKMVFISGTDPDGRGQETIRILGLDRPGLDDDRIDVIPILEPIVKKMKAAEYLFNQDMKESAQEDINKQTSLDKPHLGLRRAYFKVNGLGKYL